MGISKYIAKCFALEPAQQCFKVQISVREA